MKKFESKQLPSLRSQHEGWSIQIYSRDRRLLCVLDPSHGWMLLVGCGFGILLSILWFNLARLSSPEPVRPTTETPALQKDLSAAPQPSLQKIG